MNELLNHAWIFCLDIINNWPALVTISIIVSWVYRRISKNQQKQLKDIQMHIKRIELLQAINHDYGLQVVSGIFDEYESLGGNHYAHDCFEKYKKMKLEEK
ncbi:hypothetical protein [Lactococcus formosensis]|uniref:hypothetical protein n=1 Tax=Lactococcus formosensis TaxID=1281486 RepID=UPI0022E5F079|nr:hypothetical protein [Lactococcus formosensis]